MVAPGAVALNRDSKPGCYRRCMFRVWSAAVLIAVVALSGVLSACAAENPAGVLAELREVTPLREGQPLLVFVYVDG